MSEASDNPRTLQLGSYIRVKPDDPTEEQGIDYKQLLKVSLRTIRVLNLLIIMFMLLKHL